jgi:hypothetical protein
MNAFPGNTFRLVVADQNKLFIDKKEAACSSLFQ